MYYKIIEQFGPEDGNKWDDYLKYRGLKLTSFDSVDSLLRPSLFEPVTQEDWQYCAIEKGLPDMIMCLEYALKILHRYKNAKIVGVEIELDESYKPSKGLIGYDIIDDWRGISVLTDCGKYMQEIDDIISPNGLINNLEKAIGARNLLRQNFEDEPHASECEVWAIYKVE